MKSKYIFVVVVLLSSSILFHSSQASDGPQVIQSHGSVIYSATPPLTPSYTIYKSGSMYYSMDEDGTIAISSSDAYTVIQYAIDHTDGLIFIKDETYPISKDLSPDDGTHIKGESWNTILVRDGSNSIFLWKPWPPDYLDDCVFENFQIDGRKDGSGGWQHGFFLWNVRNLLIKNLYVHHMPACGIEIKGYHGLTTQNVVVSNVLFEDCGEATSTYYPHSLYFNGETRGVLVEDTESYRCYGSGFQLNGAGSWIRDVEFRRCISNDAGEGEGDGFIFMDGIENIRLVDCEANNNPHYGIFFWQGLSHNPIYYVTVTNSIGSGNAHYGLRFQASERGVIERITISNNKMRGNGGPFDISLNEFCDHFEITGNEGTLEYPTEGKDYEVHDNVV